MLSSASYALVLLANAPVQLDGEVTCNLVAGDDLLDRIACEVNQRLDSPPVEGICTFSPGEPMVLARNEDAVLKVRGDCETLEITAELASEDTLSCEMGVYGDWGYSDFDAGPGPRPQNLWQGVLSRQPTVIAEIEPKSVSAYTISLKCER